MSLQRQEAAGPGEEVRHLSDHVVLQEPSCVGHLQQVPRLHRLALANSQILDQCSVQGGGAVGFSQTHLDGAEDRGERQPSLAPRRSGLWPSLTSLQKSEEDFSDSKVMDQFCMWSS